MTGRERARLAAALLIGAAIAFPAGLMLARREVEPRRPTNLPAAASTRAVFSPNVLTDPYFLDQQRRGVEALEGRCRQAREMCPEARAGRQRLSELERAAR